ncbi:MAG: hypothetical protein QOE51_2106 [Actinoplanes sp.]|jgi:amino acid adenylation domain-containing protein|nr:hypothetical protein [Actinoplanes sp.]
MLSDTQRSSLTARLRQGRERPVDQIPRRGPEVTELPSSFGQEQLWFIDQFAPGLSVYNIAGVIRLRGDLDAAALGRALDDLVARHEALRTRLVNVEGRPVQVVDPASATALPFDDLSADDSAAREARLAELAAREAGQPFNLAAGPLFRTRLVRLAAREHVLVICVHHTVFDGWSFGVFLRELSAGYRARTTAASADLPELPIQFADYALWERQQLQGENLDKLTGYWKTALDGVGTVQLPTDRPRPLLQSFDGGVERLSVDADVLDGLRALGRREGATLFVTLLTALQVLLHRYSGQDDITVGTASANRSRPELAPLIGYLVNTLPIRTDTGGDPSFVELLQRVRGSTVEAYDHQDLPFAKLVETLRVERDPSRSPLFQVGFTMAESADDMRVGDLAMTVEDVEIMPAKVDLNLFVEVRESGLRLLLSYATALFDPSTARSMLEHLRVLLTGIVADPSRPLSQLPLLTPAELRRELVEWNDTTVGYPVLCVHELFEQQVERTPDGVAATMDADTLTYLQLNAQANQVARHLHERGVTPDTLVGISMQPSLRRLAALLGIMKAGAGYVPLDPDLPTERLRYMIGDARMPLIVTDTAGAFALPPTGAQTVDLDRQWSAIAAQPTGNPDFPVTSDNIAYVIYTSGSTGRPKGVVLEHAPVVNYLTGMIGHWPVGPGDRHLQFASLSFDVSVMDMFVPLCSGGTAVLASRETLHSPPRLAELMRQSRVTFACLPPAVLTLLTGQSLPDLRVLISAGEALSADLVSQWLRPGLRFYNGYGPTETACGVTLMELDATTLPPPLGRPMPNYRAYVLDRHLNPLPVGAIGELHIGGLCHAREYLNQPELTRQRFIHSPFDDDPAARLYKTGDLVRRQPDGNMQFIGRIDNQVKIRGLRIELGEIETALAAHPAVAQAHVITADDATGQKHLIGYARTDPDASATPADLRQHLARELPAYMVPTHLLVLERFPLTPNGKIDNKALPSPDSAAIDCTAPRTLIETLLVDVYATMLGSPRVGIDNSFFDLGGNSLQAMQLVTRLHNDLAVNIGVTAIFLAPTPRQLAALLRDKHGFDDADVDAAGPGLSTKDCVLVELSSGAGVQPLFLVHAIGGTVYGYTHLARELADTHRVYGVEAAGLSPNSSAATSLEAMVTDYVDAIRAAQPTGPYRLAGWSMGGLVAFEIARRLEDLGERVVLLAMLDTPFSPPVFVPAESFLLAEFVGDVARTLGWSSDEAPDADQLGWLAERLDAGAGDLAAVRAEVGRRFTVFKANITMIAGYRPKGVVRASALIAGAERSPDAALDWAAVIDGPVEAIRVPGSHYTLLQPPHVQRIAEAVRRCEVASGAVTTADCT